MSEVHFCIECNNMTYIHLDEEKNLIHACKSCGKIEKFEDDMNCIYKINFTKFDTSNVINTNKYITHDVTLPKIEGNNNIRCPNEECISIQESKQSSITYIKYDSENMKYIYICNYCGQKWKNN